MLIILSDHFEAMVAQALDDHPIETCGVIAGPAGTNLPLRLIPMRNIAKSERFFQFDPQQQLQVWKEMDGRGEKPIVLYHSHTQSRAYPSREDVMYTAETQAHYVIISTNSLYGQKIRSFRIIDGRVMEETVKMVDRYFSHADK